MNQQMCKHKLALLKGDIKMLYDQTQTAVLQDVLNSPFYPPLKERLNDYESKLAEIEREVAKVREKEKVIKRDFVYELTFGKPAPQR